MLKLFKFLLAGLPSFLIAVPLNWLLVEKFGIIKPLSYLITLFFQVCINFIFLKKFVFTNKDSQSIIKEFAAFLWGIAFFRFLDWLSYMAIVKYTSIPYLIVQIGNVIIFSVFKFVYSKKLME